MNKPITETAAPPASGKEFTDEERSLEGINADYKEKFGFHDSEEGYAYKAPKGLSREVVEIDLRLQGGARLDARVPPQGL